MSQHFCTSLGGVGRGEGSGEKWMYREREGWISKEMGRKRRRKEEERAKGR